MNPPVCYRPTLSPLAGDPPPVVRLRLVLNALLRTHRLRCEAIEQLPGRPAGRRRAR